MEIKDLFTQEKISIQCKFQRVEGDATTEYEKKVELFAYVYKDLAVHVPILKRARKLSDNQWTITLVQLSRCLGVYSGTLQEALKFTFSLVEEWTMGRGLQVMRDKAFTEYLELLRSSGVLMCSIRYKMKEGGMEVSG